MTFGSPVLLAILFGITIIYYRVQIDKYRNFQSGKPLRAWLINNAVGILSDPTSPEPARHAASFMLEAVYDHKMLRSLGEDPDKSETAYEAWDNLGTLTGKDFPIVVGAIKRLSLLLLLEKRDEGNAIRQIYGDDLSIADLSVAESDTHSYERAMSLGSNSDQLANRHVTQDQILSSEPLAPRRTTRVVANSLEASICH